jgi:hypothetical protein
MEDAKKTAGLAARAASGRLVWVALALYGGLFAAAAGWRLAVDGAWPWRVAASEAPGWPLAQRVIAGLALGAAMILASRVWTTRTPVGRRLAVQLAALVAGLGRREVVALALLSGVAEEAFFRGALQPRVGWLAASALFGLAHFHPRRDLRAWSASALLAGLALGALFEASGDLVAPAVAHSLVNAVNLRWLAREGAALRDGTPGPDPERSAALDGDGQACDASARVDARRPRGDANDARNGTRGV